MNYIILLLFNIIFIFCKIGNLRANRVPVISLNNSNNSNVVTQEPLKHLPFLSLIEKDMDTSEYWRETEILALIRKNAMTIDYERCERAPPNNTKLSFSTFRTVRPICRSRIETNIKRYVPKSPCSCQKFRSQPNVGKNRTMFAPRCSKCKTREGSSKRPEAPKNLVFNQFSRRSRSDDDSDNNYQVCPQCPHFSNHTECELFRDSCRERKVLPSEYRTYCAKKYGRWRAMFVPADYSQCRCCDECIFYRELDQSCMADEYTFETEEFLPVTTIDFRAGCNPYWGHPEQEYKALRCDKTLRRCVPVTVPQIPNETLISRRSFRYEPATGDDCPTSCRGYECSLGQVNEESCARGGFLPDKDQCNCCGRCSVYQQLGEKCAEFKKTYHRSLNGTVEIEVEEEFLEPGCDDGLVCRQGQCQDIHVVSSGSRIRTKRDEEELGTYEPCKLEIKYFKKKYGPNGHLHYNAPQCTPLWLYAPVQCRRFVCYCALEDGSFIKGIKVPRVEVSNMNCDCAREKCRTGSNVECDGYGNYKEAVFTQRVEDDVPVAHTRELAYLTTVNLQSDEILHPTTTTSVYST